MYKGFAKNVLILLVMGLMVLFIGCGNNEEVDDYENPQDKVEVEGVEGEEDDLKQEELDTEQNQNIFCKSLVHSLHPPKNIKF